MKLSRPAILGIFLIVVITGIFAFNIQLLPNISNQDDDTPGYDLEDITDFKNSTNNEGIHSLKVFQNLDLSEHSFPDFTNSIRSGGVSKDGIPPIENPQYVSASDITQSELEDWEIVFGINYKGFVAAYPQRILVWHEIVNEEINGESVSITYCPLTGSTIGYQGHVTEGDPTFGVSGKLLNSNLVMYDRATDSYWPQIFGRSITGDSVGDSLNSVQIYWSTWEQWKAEFPDTLVLTEDTGHVRSYGYDPYGSYAPGIDYTYYQAGGAWFGTMSRNTILQSKDIVYGLQFGNSYLAIQKSALKQVTVLNYEIGDKSIVAIYDDNLDVGYVFDRTLNGVTYTFNFVEGEIRDIETNTLWNLNAQSILGNLNQEVYIDVMWFGWFAYFPTTQLIYI